MECPRLDHFGLSVGAESELDDILARAKAWQERDDRVDIIDKQVDDHGMLAITSIYVRYLLPMMSRSSGGTTTSRDAGSNAEEPRDRTVALGRVRAAGLEARVHAAGRAADAWDRTKELAQLTEQLGYDHLWVYDHVETVPRREPTHVFEAFTTLAALAQHTTHDQARPDGHVRGVPQRGPARQGSRVRRRVLRRPADPRHRRGLVRARVPGVRLPVPERGHAACRSSRRRSR